MARLILLIAFGVVLLIAWRRFQGLSGAERKKYAWQVAAIAGGILLLLLVVTGRMPLIGAALAAAIPLARRLLPLALPWLHHLRPPTGGGTNTGGQQSTVKTDTLSMQLDHDSGRITGSVTAGAFQGRPLEQMSERELLTLYQHCCQHDQDSARLLQSYLDQRLGADWHSQGQEQAPAGTPGQMSETEALAILGLEHGADREQILQAHRRLIQKLHPDRGGNTYLAAQLNRARDKLLS